MEAVGSELGEAIPLFLRPLIPGANPVVSGTINTLGFYYYYHPREAHHRCSPGLTLKFPSPRLEEGEEEEEDKKEKRRKRRRKSIHSLICLLKMVEAWWGSVTQTCQHLVQGHRRPQQNGWSISSGQPFPTLRTYISGSWAPTNLYHLVGKIKSGLSTMTCGKAGEESRGGAAAQQATSWA